MKLHIYVFRNSVLECTGNPIFDDHEPEVFAKQIERQIVTGQPEKVAQYSNVTFYHLGTYDDESMRCDMLKDPQLILDCNLVVEKRKIRLAFIKEAEKIVAKQKSEKKEGVKHE